MTRSSLFFTVLVVGAIAGLGWFGWEHLAKPEDRLRGIPTAEVTQGRFEVAIVSIGQLQAARSAVLGAPYEGKITQLIPEGTRVDIGDPVAWFETTDLEDRLIDHEAQLELDQKNLQAALDAFELEKVRNEYSLESEKNRVEVQHQSYEDARQKYEAERVLFERNVSPETRLNEARLALLQAELNLRNAQINLARVEENLAANLRVKEREIEQARLAVQNTERRVNDAQRDIENAVVRATSPGDISYMRIWKSGVVSKVAEGDTVWRRSNIIEIPDTSVMMAVVPVNEIDTSRVEIGKRAEVELMAMPGVLFPAVVETKSVVPISDPSQQSWDRGTGQERPGPREFEVRVRLEETDEFFRQGMTATARIIVDEIEDAVQVPLEALFERGREQGVFVTEGGSGYQFVPLEVVLTNENFAAVEGALLPGSRVLLADPEGGAAPVALATIEEEYEDLEIGEPI